MVIAMRTGERATAVDRSLVTSSGITELRSHGNPSFRSQWRTPLLRLSKTVRQTDRQTDRKTDRDRQTDTQTVRNGRM